MDPSPPRSAASDEREKRSPTQSNSPWSTMAATATERPSSPYDASAPSGSAAFHRGRGSNHDSGAMFSPKAYGQLSPQAGDRVFPIRSAVTIDPTSTPAPQRGFQDGYFPSARTSEARRHSNSTEGSTKHAPTDSRKFSAEQSIKEQPTPEEPQPSRRHPPRLPPQIFSDIGSARHQDEASETAHSSHGGSVDLRSVKTVQSEKDDLGGVMTARFKHVVTEDGHAIVTGRDGETLQRCEDEPIHIPGAIQGFGLIIVLQDEDGKFVVRIVSENSKKILGYSPKQLFALDSFTDILSEEQADNLLDHIDFIRDEDADVATNGPEVFTISIRTPRQRSVKFWCAMHLNERNPGLIICEFELEDDPTNPLSAPTDVTPGVPEDTLNSNPTAEEFLESTENVSRPLRVLRSARKRKGEAAAMEVFNIMSQVQEQLAAAPNLETFLKVLCGVVKELTGFHRVMIYQFDQAWNGRVVTELVDPRATLDLYKGLNFPASDIPKQARDLYRLNRVRLLYDRDQETARLVCRTTEDLENPLDMSYAYLRAMSPIHIKYLENMAVRSSMSISINAFNELWGLIACHTYGPRGMRVSFPIRKMCRLVGDSASRNIERLSYASRLQARKLINTAPSQSNPSGYIIASSEDLLKLFDADYGLLSIRDETKILGQMEQTQEALAMLEYLRMRQLTAVTSTQDITQDFPDLRYQPGFSKLAGALVVPLSGGGQDFIVFFRKGQLREVKWAGNPYEKYIKEGTEGYLEPRKSFKTWSETVVGKCREWTEEEIETAAVLCLVYGKFIEVWRQKEAALQNSQLTKLLLANSAHEVRTPLNAIINYLEIALEGSLDQETRDNLAKSHSASKSLIYVINDLLDLTKTEEGVELIKGEAFDIQAIIKDATEPFKGDAKRKNIDYNIILHPGLPKRVLGDQRRVRQAISNVCANAIQHTSKGGVKVEVYTNALTNDKVSVEIVIEDTGIGMNSKQLDALFRELEQVSSETDNTFDEDRKQITEGTGKADKEKPLGLGLAVVARTIRNMNGQLRLKSEEGEGSRFVLQLPFDLPDGEQWPESSETPKPGLVTEQSGSTEGEVMLVQNAPDRRPSETPDGLSRKNSADSVHSRRSMRSIGSIGSGHSNKSEADRLIEAMQEPHRLDGNRPGGERSLPTSLYGRPRIESRHSYSPASPSGRPRAASIEAEPGFIVSDTPERRSLGAAVAGEQPLEFSSTPLRALKMPDEMGAPTIPRALRKSQSGSILGEVQTQDQSVGSKSPTMTETSVTSTQDGPSQEPLNMEHMCVLVAEDDPVNSRIVKKRMEKFGHKVVLTSNGEECASAFGDNPGQFDAVLMDMQMPIVDGLSSTKMIRSFEKTSSRSILSARAACNGRLPIIAVSASLVERERQQYIDAGFDAWILKPISFQRLNELMTAIIDSKVRDQCLYRPGRWEQGGWFTACTTDRNREQGVNTKPDTEKIPAGAPSKATRVAAASDGPGEDGTEGRQPDEQRRLLREQERLREDGYTASPEPMG